MKPSLKKRLMLHRIAILLLVGFAFIAVELIYFLYLNQSMVTKTNVTIFLFIASIGVVLILLLNLSLPMSQRLIRDLERISRYLKSQIDKNAFIDPKEPCYAEFYEVLEELREVNKDRRKSEERYREIVEKTENLVTEVNAEGKFTFVNQAAKKILGLNPDKCFDQSAFDFIHKDDRKKTEEEFKHWVDKKKRNVTFENRQVSKSGEIRNMLWSIRFHYDDHQNISSIKSIARDITDLKEKEKKLKESEEKYRNLVDSIPFAVKIYQDHRILFTNEPGRSMFKIKNPDKTSSRNIEEWIPDEEKDRIFSKIERIMQKDPAAQRRFETIFQRDDGEKFDAEVFVSDITHKNRPAYQVVIIDITDRKRIEAELKKRHNHLDEPVVEKTADLEKSEEPYREIVKGTEDLVA